MTFSTSGQKFEMVFALFITATHLFAHGYSPYKTQSWGFSKIWHDIHGRSTSVPSYSKVSTITGRESDAKYCATLDCKPEVCLTYGCAFCISDQQCYATPFYAPDCITKPRAPCKVFTSNEERCILSGCAYDKSSEKCSGTIAGIIGGIIAYNICGTRAVNKDGALFFPMEPTARYTCHISNTLKSHCPGYPDEQEMYRVSAYGTYMTMAFDIPGDGVYEVGVYTCETLDDRRKNYLTVNGIKIQVYDVVDGTVSHAKKYFSVTDNGRTVYSQNVDNQCEWANISGKQLFIRFEPFPGFYRTDAVINGIYLRKIAYNL